MKLNTEVKYLTIKQSAIFLLVSLSLFWSWMFITAKIDRGNDRGLMTSFGTIVILTFILVRFFSKAKSGEYLATFFFLTFGNLLSFILTMTIGFAISVASKWIGFIVPIATTTFLLFFILRRLFSFPDNFVAFWVLFSLPILTAITLKILPFYDSIVSYHLGLGFPIAIYLSFVFIAIAILCRESQRVILEE
ncbi:hypothetical protein C8C83_2255 [Flavobacterium sp. 90]|uniref:hypothetical protein n=1 Tax=unclassified Flavobacterium TaxID=196869 RepID=UPI000EAD5AB5|nr:MULTISPECIES: hypothetical protein [unclassified Flavobacterium]RKR10578.1 hypothetical protein C8C82_2559 [Flavobacterium sp. 81]TCK54362.1 hypothetical protein C8C83_2255 [Flavobacterium sp. 90]